MRLPGDAKDRPKGRKPSSSGFDRDGGKKYDRDRDAQRELQQRLLRLDRNIPVPEKAATGQLLYRLQAQSGRKSRIPSWTRTLGLSLACCFVAVFGLWGFFSGAFESLFGAKNLSTGDSATMQGYRAGDSLSSAASAGEEENATGLQSMEGSGSFLIQSVTYSGMTDGGDLYFISRSYSDLQKLLDGQDCETDGSGDGESAGEGSGNPPAKQTDTVGNHALFGEGPLLFYQSEGALYQLNTADNVATRLMDLSGELKLARMDSGFFLLATETQGTRPDGQTETVTCSSVYLEGSYDQPLASRAQSGSLVDMALLGSRVVVLTEKPASAQSSLEELAVYAGSTPRQLEEVSSSMAFVLPVQNADRFTVMSTLPLNSSEEALCRFVVGRELTADLRNDGIYLFSDSRWSVCMVRFQTDAQLSFYDAKAIPGNCDGRYYTNGRDNRWLLVEQEGKLKAYQLVSGLSNSLRGEFQLEGSLTDAAIVSHYLYFSNGTDSWRADINSFLRQEELTELHYAATRIRALGSKLLLYDENTGTLYLADVEQPGRWARIIEEDGVLPVEDWLNASLLREKTSETGELIAVRNGDAQEVYELDGLSLNLLGRYQASELILTDSVNSADAQPETAPSLGSLYLWQNNAVTVLELTVPQEPAVQNSGQSSDGLHSAE